MAGKSFFRMAALNTQKKRNPSKGSVFLCVKRRTDEVHNDI